MLSRFLILKFVSKGQTGGLISGHRRDQKRLDMILVWCSNNHEYLIGDVNELGHEVYRGKLRGWNIAC